MRATVTHHGPMTSRRTYDRRGCLKKEDKYASGLMLRRTSDRALKMGSSSETKLDEVVFEDMLLS